MKRALNSNWASAAGMALYDNLSTGIKKIKGEFQGGAKAIANMSQPLSREPVKPQPKRFKNELSMLNNPEKLKGWNRLGLSTKEQSMRRKVKDSWDTVKGALEQYGQKPKTPQREKTATGYVEYKHKHPLEEAFRYLGINQTPDFQPVMDKAKTIAGNEAFASLINKGRLGDAGTWSAGKSLRPGQPRLLPEPDRKQPTVLPMSNRGQIPINRNPQNTGQKTKRMIDGQPEITLDKVMQAIKNSYRQHDEAVAKYNKSNPVNVRENGKIIEFIHSPAYQPPLLEELYDIQERYKSRINQIEKNFLESKSNILGDIASTYKQQDAEQLKKDHAQTVLEQMRNGKPMSEQEKALMALAQQKHHDEYNKARPMTDYENAQIEQNYRKMDVDLEKLLAQIQAGQQPQQNNLQGELIKALLNPDMMTHMGTNPESGNFDAARLNQNIMEILAGSGVEIFQNKNTGEIRIGG